jgi:hypothetical protein
MDLHELFMLTLYFVYYFVLVFAIQICLFQFVELCPWSKASMADFSMVERNVRKTNLILPQKVPSSLLKLYYSLT